MDNWRDRAVCRGSDPTLFFPAVPTDNTYVAGLCASCPVQESCLAEALRMRDTYGFRGGKTGEERREMIPRGKVPVPVEKILRRHHLHWNPAAIAIELGVNVDVVRRAVREHAGDGAAA